MLMRCSTAGDDSDAGPSAGDEGGQQGLHLVDVHAAPELLGDALPARDPDRQFGVEVEAARRLHAEVRDALVRHRVVLHLAAGDALLVDEDQPAVGEDEDVADELVARVHLLALGEQAAVLLSDTGGVDPRRVAGDAVEETHAIHARAARPARVRGSGRRTGRRRAAPGARSRRGRSRPGARGAGGSVRARGWGPAWVSSPPAMVPSRRCTQPPTIRPSTQTAGPPL